MFWMDDRLPSRLAPGRRPRTTLTPTLLTRDGAPYLGLGSPGGDQQDQWTLVMLLRHLQHKRDLQAAIDAPLFHTTHYVPSFFPRAFQPGGVMIEARFPEATLTALRERGHTLSVQDDWALGRLCAAGRWQGQVRAAATPRFMQAYAMGAVSGLAKRRDSRYYTNLPNSTSRTGDRGADRCRRTASVSTLALATC